MSQRLKDRNRVKISTTVDPRLLDAVDAFVEAHAEFNRSRVFDDALRLWHARERDKALEAQYGALPSPNEREERAQWRQIQADAAARLFRKRI